MSLLSFLQSWINMTQLSILGINETYLYGAIVLLGIIISYFIIEPIISWFVALGSQRLLSYLISSLIVLVLFITMILFNDHLHHLFFDLLKIAFTSISLFGIILAVYNYIKRLIQRQKKSV